MRLRIISFLLLSIIAFSVWGCSTPTSNTPQESTFNVVTPPAMSTAVSLSPTPSLAVPDRGGNTMIPMLPNLLIQVNGQVSVRREGQNADQRIRLGVGARVQPGDLLYISTGSSLALFCGNESLGEKNPRVLDDQEVPHGVPCLAGAPPRPAPDVARLRGTPTPMPENGENLPYVLSPRSGQVSNERPVLRWQSVPGIETYTISLESDDGTPRPGVTVSGSETDYPTAWLPLQAGGAGYLLQIAGGIPTSLGFSLLEPADIARLQNQRNLLPSYVTVEPGHSLLLAELYLSYQLRSEAVETLLALPNYEQVPAISQLLGETYLFMGLFKEAQETLEVALSLARQNSLPEAEADALYLLGLAACGLSLEEQAETHWRAALMQYQALDLATASASVTEQLNHVGDNCTIKQGQ